MLLFRMGGVIVVIEFVSTAISLLIAAFNKPVTHTVPCFLEIGEAEFKISDSIISGILPVYV